MDTPHPPPGLQPNEPSWQLRVLDRSGSVVGGAVLVSPGLLVTCAHVVSDALGRHPSAVDHPGPGAPVVLRSFDGRDWEAVVSTELWDAGPGSRDLALLTLPGERGLPDTGFPTLGRAGGLDRSQRLTVVGYSVDLRSLSARLSYEGMSGATPYSHQVETPKRNSVQITPGFSGCAVRTGTGEVVGIMQHNLTYGWLAPGEPAGTSFFLPVEEMVGSRSGVLGPVTLRRLAGEAVCGARTYESLHDTLESVSTEEILKTLNAMEEAPWGDIRGKQLDARALARRLKPYGVMPKSVRVGQGTPKGYTREDLFDAWERYLPSGGKAAATSATTRR